MTQSLDLNLLVALDVLLEEQSVQGAARRLHLSDPAMSRTLGRIRTALGDPVLVRAGRHMVPTPRALAVRAEVSAVVERARAVFSSGVDLDLRAARRTFTIVANDLLAALHGAALMERIAGEAPGIRLRFLSETLPDAPLLRQGTADLEVGDIDTTDPEVHVEELFADRMLGVVRAGHPLLTGKITPRRFAEGGRHLIVSRRGRLCGPIDEALADLGLARDTVASVGTYPSSLFVVRDSDLIGLVGRSSRSLAEALGLVVFEIPLPLPTIRVGLAWHPRHDADPVHDWLRRCVREVVRPGEQ
ncbi:LysR family transcriptional regulator [Pseudoclavibacter chungangensis]|uniref:LysR family transcriptional regulator n=1 Tax=Pseudoclavibacter chungangensis TaxID=587635 RepID=A0A7J5BMS0_9MICO|nr:LysR family transcriptional regulator [Pseudoclavibacter chungangensis]KAB1652970.1 LysR family transcriptional regulator [Pseudoclavibacter chungangensis]NYJ65230.1 DNA-binding transcriptional LysR family regulator [Pseudoclavibacter chungangensis]